MNKVLQAGAKLRNIFDSTNIPKLFFQKILLSFFFSINFVIFSTLHNTFFHFRHTFFTQLLQHYAKKIGTFRHLFYYCLSHQSFNHVSFQFGVSQHQELHQTLLQMCRLFFEHIILQLRQPILLMPPYF